MRAKPERLRHALFKLGLDLFGRLAFGKAGAVAHAEDVRIDRESLLPEPAVKHDIGSLAADARQRDQLLDRKSVV